MKRLEKDFLGEVEIPMDALYGIHAFRARENFPDATRFHKEWYMAVGQVKQAVYKTYRNFKTDTLKSGIKPGLPLVFFDDDIIDALEYAAEQVSSGEYFDEFIVPAISGGAGTSINMNINEIIANLALKHLGREVASYDTIDPFLHANVYQSTNDVIPTALKVAIMQLLIALEESINNLRQEVEKKEGEHRNSIRMAYTQLQEAVPASWGSLFSTYSEALSRDWWRVSKAFERIKTVNLGGSAIGTGIAVPRYFIMIVVKQLARLTDLPLSRGENLQDVTANLDSFVEVHAILKAHAVNLEKMANDLRLLSSDLRSGNDIRIPQKQVGSSIMPAKVNPVIAEFVVSASRKVYANDMLITDLSAQTQLDLNAYLPAIGHAFIESLKLLTASCNSMKDNMITGLKVDHEISYNKVLHSPAVTTALSPYIGYHKAAKISRKMKADKIDVFEANRLLGLINHESLATLLQPDNLLKLGFSIKDDIDK